MSASGTTATDDRAPAAEGDQAQHDHGRVDVEQHRAVRLLDDDVGRRLDAGAAGGQQERAILVVVRPRELRSGVHDAGERLRLVVGEIRDHRHHRALGVEEIGIVDGSLLRRVVQHVLVAVEREPLRIALERAGGDLPCGVGQRDRRLHARYLPQRPRQPVGVDQRFVFEAAFLARLHDQRELVRGQRVVSGDVGVVLVVARAGSQLRRAGIEVADLEPLRRRRGPPPPAPPTRRSRRSPSCAS